MLPAPGGPGPDWETLAFPRSGAHLACEVEPRTPGLPRQGPARSDDGRLGAAFAGWLHNSAELRARFGIPPRASESHLLLAMYREHGEELVSRLQGRFVFALWDDEERRLVLGRDAAGIRVLYTLEDGDGLLFASRIKALLRTGRSRKELDPRSVDTLLTLRRVPGTSTLVSDIRRLPAGGRLVQRDGVSRVDRWFDLDLTPHPITLDEAREELSALLGRAVARCCPDNETIGLSYSGGLDSTRLLELAAERAGGAVEAFTFLHGKDHGDFLNARRWTRRLNVPHEEIDVRDVPFEGLFPEVLWILDDPIADLSVINPFLLIRTASERVRYSMDGIGTDQAFGGCLYHRPMLFALRHGSTPGLGALASLAGRAVARAPVHHLNRLIERLEPSYSMDPTGRFRVARLLRSVRDPQAMMKLMIGLMQEEQRRWLYTPEQARRLEEAGGFWQPPAFLGGGGSPEEQMTRLFRFEILDSMAHCQCRVSESVGQHHGVEQGAPFLDADVLRFVFGLPFDLKIDRFQNKILIRRLRSGSDRSFEKLPKQAGNIAIDQVFGDRIFAFCSDVLTPQRQREAGLMRPEAVAEMLGQCRGQGGMFNCMYAMALTSLELWRRMYLESSF